MVARVESKHPAGGHGSSDGPSAGVVAPDEGADETPWRRLVASPSSEVKGLVATLAAASPRLAAAAVSAAAVCAAAAKLHAPRPQPQASANKGAEDDGGGGGGDGDDADGGGSSSSSRRREARAAAAAKGAREAAVAAMAESVSSKEASDRFVEAHAKALAALLAAGAQVDAALEDELLRPDGAAWAAQAAVFAAAQAAMFAPGRLVRQTSVPMPKAGSGAVRPPPAAAAPDADDDDGGGGGALDVQTMMATMMSTLPGAAGGGDEGGVSGGVGPLAPQQSAWAAKRDKLNLSGLLNVLDGVVDTPGRLVVLSTNHPEHLDPALIRPGRIDKKLFLGYMSAPHVVAMVEHYFQGALKAEQAARVQGAIEGDDRQGLPRLNLTPAQVEQMAAEHDAVEDMVLALEMLGLPRSKLTRQGSSTTVTFK